jgi:hypothetical protein
VLWTIFSISADGRVPVLSLFQRGGFPDPWAGAIIAAVGVLASVAWLLIQHRALFHLTRHEDRMAELERGLGMPPSPSNNGTRARRIMRWCSRVAIAAWSGALVAFVTLAVACPHPH